MAMDQIEYEKPDKSGDGTPVCLRCFKPVDPLAYYCPHCGEATGQFTQYLPFESIPWMTRIWGQVWRQIWSRDISLPGRIFRLVMVVWNVPIMLIGLFFKPGQKPKQEQHQNDAGPNKQESLPPR
jgi:hypothetical protein